MDRPLPASSWGFHPFPPPPRSVVELIRSNVLDAELAALLWLLLEGRVPLVVAARQSRVGKSTVLGALLDFLPPAARRFELRGFAETFDWLPQARELGWSGRSAPAGSDDRGDRDRADPRTAWLLAAELSNHHPAYTWGEAARVAVRATTIGYGLGATIHADSLEEVIAVLRHPPVALTDDELSGVGVVLVLRTATPPSGDAGTDPLRRVVAAHYVRPVSRDVHGHVQRLGPAVLATWDSREDRFEHFAWGVTRELADRVGRRTGDFAAEQERRREFLQALADAGITDVASVRAAVDGYRAMPDGAGIN